jgi:hypothetical protein
MIVNGKPYYQVSGRYRTAAAFPPGMTGIQALQHAVGQQERPFRADYMTWADKMGEGHAGDHYLRCYATDTVEMSIEEWREWKRNGGTTYLDYDYHHRVKNDR